LATGRTARESERGQGLEDVGVERLDDERIAAALGSADAAAGQFVLEESGDLFGAGGDRRGERLDAHPLRSAPFAASAARRRRYSRRLRRRRPVARGRCRPRSFLQPPPEGEGHSTREGA
jgi:hypothetical protein